MCGGSGAPPPPAPSYERCLGRQHAAEARCCALPSGRIVENRNAQTKGNDGNQRTDIRTTNTTQAELNCSSTQNAGQHTCRSASLSSEQTSTINLKFNGLDRKQNQEWTRMFTGPGHSQKWRCAELVEPEGKKKMEVCRCGGPAVHAAPSRSVRVQARAAVGRAPARVRTRDAPDRPPVSAVQRGVGVRGAQPRAVPVLLQARPPGQAQRAGVRRGLVHQRLPRQRRPGLPRRVPGLRVDRAQADAEGLFDGGPGVGHLPIGRCTALLQLPPPPSRWMPPVNGTGNSPPPPSRDGRPSVSMLDRSFCQGRSSAVRVCTCV